MQDEKLVDERKSELHKLLLRAVPANSLGRKTIAHLAVQLQVSKATIWHWLKKDFLPPNRATEIVKLSEGRVTLDELHRFVYAG